MNLSGQQIVKLILDQNKWILYQEEYKIFPDRKYHADFAIIEHKILIEVEGGTWSLGRHVRGAGYARDCQKYNAATVHGWRVLRYTTDMLRNYPNRVIEDIQEIIRKGAA